MLATSKSISGFDPRSIPGCTVWFDAADTSTITTTGTTVTAWSNKTGNASATTGAGTVSINQAYLNGISSIRFPAGTNYLNVGAITYSTGYRNVFMVATVSAASAFYFGDAGDYVAVQFYSYSTGDIEVNKPGANGLVVTPSGFFGKTALVSTCTVSGNQGIWINGVSQTLTANGVTTASNFWNTGSTTAQTLGGQSGASSSGVVDMYEILQYDGPMTATQRQSVEGYLAWKWGLQVQTPVAPVLTPLSVPGCQLWLDAADTTKIAPSAGGTLTSWTDKSGTGKTVTVASAPTYSLTAFNGLPCLTFASGNSLTIPITAPGTNDIAIFAVWKETTSGSANAVFSIGSPGGGTETAVGWNGGEVTYKLYRYGGPESVNNTVSYNTTVVSSGLQLSGFRYIYINGINPTGGTGAADAYNQTNTTAYIGGGSFPLIGQVAEIIYYQATLSTTQRQSIENYLMGKWGIKPSLPATHPFYSTPALSRPFGPADIPGCALWFDAADASSITLNGSTVSKWSDKSGNGNHLTQGTTSAQPTYGTYLSYPGVYFNGANTQVLSTTYNQTGTGGRNTFIVFYDISTSPNIYGDPGLMYMGGSVAVGSAWRTQYIATSDALCVDIGAGVKIMTTSPNVTSMRTTRSVAMWAAPNSATVATTYVYGNGTQFTVQGANSVGLTTAVNTVGGLGTTIGKSTTSVISEILHYSTELTTAQRQQVEGYLAAKWGLLNNLPGKTLSPLNIPGCVLWLDVSDPSTVTSGSTVTSITDKSPNKLTTTLSSTLPTYSATQINGTPGISFTGSSWIRGNFTSAYTGSNLIVFAVGSATSTANAYRRLVSFSVPGTYDYVSSSQVIPILLQSANAVIESFRAGDQASKSISYGTNYLFEAEYTGSSNNFYLNGGSPASVASSGTFNISNWGIGYLADYGNTSDAAYWTGNFGEVVVYFGSLTTLQRQSVENYLMSKWGISNVTTHPFKNIPPSTSQPPQFQEVTPGNWTRDWQPYLKSLAAANSSATASIGTSITPSVSGGFAATLAPNGNLYTYSWSGTGITVINTNSGSLVTTITGTGIQGERYFSSCLGPDGNIYYPPYNLSTAGILYTATNTFSASAITMGTSPSSGAYCGAVLAPNGKIYCIPRAYGTAASIGIIDTVAKTFNIMASAVVTANQGYIGGVLAPNGKIYCIPFVDGGSVSVGIVDPDANTFTTMPSSSVSTVGAYNGGVLAPNGKIYCIPYNATNVGIIDPVANTFNTTTITNAPGSAAYTGGCLGPNGKIYFASRSATAFGVVDPVANTLATTGGVSGTSGTGYTGAFLTSTGKFYCPNLSTVVNVVNFSSLNQTPSLNYCLSAYTNKS